ncbi:histidine kinase [Amycolatopsis sp. NPDC004169]|uniref:sensor histidine kinase n=1 Tax=Amycolatopsis sp. NPDC004169 TaxID=3154453 RepID=UPI0033AA52E6
MRLVQRYVRLTGATIAVTATSLAILAPQVAAPHSITPDPPTASVWALVAAATGITVISVVYRLRAGLPSFRVSLVIMLVQCGVTVTAIVILGPGTSVELLTPATALFILADPWSWIGFIGLQTVELGFFHDYPSLLALLCTVAHSLVTGFALYALVKVTEHAVTLRRAQVRMVDLAIANERLRISRDLHDTLGQELTAIGLRAELAEKILSTAPQRAAEHLRGIQHTTERTLTEVRGVARGDWNPAFDDAVASASILLETAGVRCNLDIGTRPQGLAEHVASWAVREATTNVLNHSIARFCTITTRNRDDLFLLTVDNDGVQTPGLKCGAGLAGLDDRVTRIGGVMRAGRRGRTGYRLTVEIPETRGAL